MRLAWNDFVPAAPVLLVLIVIIWWRIRNDYIRRAENMHISCKYARKRPGPFRFYNTAQYAPNYGMMHVI